MTEIEIQEQKKEKDFAEAKELMDAIGRYVNYGKSKKAFIEAFKREHRTLQQSAFRMMLELIEEMATENYRTDGRNEDSKKMAKTLLDGFKEAKKKEYMAMGYSSERAEDFLQAECSNKPSAYLQHI